MVTFKDVCVSALLLATQLSATSCWDTCDTHYLGSSIYVAEINGSPCVSGCDMVLGEDCKVRLPTGANGIGGEVRSWRTIEDRDDGKFHKIERVVDRFFDRTDTIRRMLVLPLSE